MWQFRTGTGDEYASLMNDEGGFVFYGAEPSDEQGAILAEALNVHEQTGLTPAQLQARVAELEGALREYQGYSHHSDAGNTLSAMRHFEKFESELARLIP